MKSPNLQFSACRSDPNPARFVVVPVLLFLCLGVFMALPAFACHNGKNHGPHICDGGGGGEGEGPVLGGPTMASFIGPAVLDEDGARACEPLGELTAGAGRFNCDVDTPVRASTAGMTLQSRKRDIAFCRSLEHFSQNQGSHVDAAPERWPDVYQYGWTDDCTDGACQIVVDLSFSGAAILEATGGKSDAVDVRVSGTLSGDELAGNPFSGVQGLAMSLVSLQFRKPGETAIAAVCDWYPDSVVMGSQYQHVVFTSEALPQD